MGLFPVEFLVVVGILYNGLRSNIIVEYQICSILVLIYFRWATVNWFEEAEVVLICDWFLAK